MKMRGEEGDGDGKRWAGESSLSSCRVKWRERNIEWEERREETRDVDIYPGNKRKFEDKVKMRWDLEARGGKRRQEEASWEGDVSMCG